MARASRLPRDLSTWLLSAACAVLAGAAIGYGQPLGLAVVGAGVGFLIILLLGERGFPMLIAWVLLEGIAFPFIRAPAGSNAVITFDRIALVGFVVVLLFQARRLPRSRPSRLLLFSLVWLTAAFGLRALTTTGANSGQLRALAAFVDALMLPTLVLAVTALLVRSKLQVQFVAGALAATGAVVALLGLAQRYAGVDLSPLSGGVPRFDRELGFVRVSGPYNIPEVYGVVLHVCLGGTLYWMLVRGRTVYALALPILALELSAIGLTYFRAAWIGAVVILVFALGIRPRRFARSLGAVSLTVAVLYAAHGAVQGDNPIASRVENTENVNGRVATYVRGIEMFKTAPLMGVGIDQFQYVGLPHMSYAGVRSLSRPHSSYVGMLSEAGLLGFIPFLCATLATWYVLRQFGKAATSREDVLLASTVKGVALAYLIMSLSLTMIPYGPSNAFFVLALGLAAGRLDEIGAKEVCHN